MRLGILGGTFDPIHHGHLAVAGAACAALNLPRLIVVPSQHPPHRPTEPRASGYHRFTMAALATLPRLSAPEWLVSDVELAATEPSYTSTTLRRLLADGYRPSQLFFITGADAFAEIATWKDYPALFELAHFIVVSRPGHSAASMPDVLPTLRERMIMGQPDTRPPGPVGPAAASQPCAAERDTAIWLVDAATPDISSTEIRHRLRNRESVVGLVPQVVEAYIRRYGLYDAAPLR